MILTGQIFGWLSALLTFISYQCKKHRTLIIVNTLASLSLCVSYFFLDAYSGMVLNCISLIRNTIIYKKDWKIFSYSFWPYVLAGMMGIAGILSWQGPISLLIVSALTINALFMAFPNVQNLRKSILLTSPMVIIYNAYYGVWGGVVNEMIAICSAVIGLYRYRENLKI